jgi:phosphoribosylaminoimidazolecarboxamide formyltransferase/IMP cyclohydrolase
LRALLSVATRDGISAFARGLQSLGVDVFATDGTRDHLAQDGIEVKAVAELTGVPQMLDGSVKTFHHAIYAGILARRDQPDQLAELKREGIEPIDLVVVNVRPFGAEIGRALIGIDKAIDMIDVGGAALLGAAARNPAGVAAVSNPEQYPHILGEIKERGQVSPELRAQLAAEAFGMVAAYHAEIAAYLNQLSSNTFPKRLAVVLEKVDDLRYGENPHQRAAFYRETTHRSGTLADATQIRGDRPSFNNYLDLDTAYRIARDFTTPAVAIVKHTDPVGLASADELVEAYRHALDTDPIAAFGGIVGVNREMDGPTAREIAANSYEAVVAPAYSHAALGILKQKAGLEILAVPPDPTDGMRDYGIASLDFKRVAGGVLVESLDEVGLDRGRLQVVTRRRPTLDELNDLLFAWRTVCHVRSNAIVLARGGATVGIGAAQASRQTSVEIAVRKAGERASGAALASDAFFPFDDGPRAAVAAGVKAIIQPGGSKRDDEVIATADELGVAMVFTGRRHFRH